MVSLRDYVSFLLLLFALYVISGGVRVAGTLAGTPTVNAGLLAIGSLLASVVGTTGASMLLLRPLLRANAVRKRKQHVVLFFIFVVSNCGGLLTPLGDPPLFLGFMKGVSFGWTIRLFAPWLLVNGLLIVVFHFLDSHWFHREDVEEPRGAHDLDRAVESAGASTSKGRATSSCRPASATLFLAGMDGAAGRPGRRRRRSLLTLASIFFTPKSIRRENQFSYAPVVEVAVLFLGIFLAMVPALEILNRRGAELPLAGPRAFFWATGALSSFLDNAPTYLTFAAVAAGRQGVTTDGAYLARFLALGGDSPRVLAAISCGAVFMGALTYIGNGPNFMVKAIAEHHHVKMPSFFGYMAWSCAVLLPIFVVVTFAFF